jgi:hypothetical protein
MSILFITFFVFVALLFCVFVWSLRKPATRADKSGLTGLLKSTSRTHVNFMPQVRQALSAADHAFLVERSGNKLAKRVQRERKTITLSYLSALQGDFEKLLEEAKLIAVLSPEVVALHEFERIRLSLEFSLRYKWIRARTLFGWAPVPQLCSLGDFVSALTVRIESAMRELAEHAAAAAELASPLDRRGIDSI